MARADTSYLGIWPQQQGELALTRTRGILGPQDQVDIPDELIQYEQAARERLRPFLEQQLRRQGRGIYQQGITGGQSGSGRLRQIQFGARAQTMADWTKQIQQGVVGRQRFLEEQAAAERARRQGLLIQSQQAGQQFGLQLAGLRQQQQQFEESQPKWYDYLLKGIGSVAGIVGAFGKLGGGGTATTTAAGGTN